MTKFPTAGIAVCALLAVVGCAPQMSEIDRIDAAGKAGQTAYSLPRVPRPCPPSDGSGGALGALAVTIAAANGCIPQPQLYAPPQPQWAPPAYTPQQACIYGNGLISCQ